GVISSELPEFATTVSPDGRELFFNRTAEDRSSMRIYRASWNEGGWAQPTALPFTQGDYVDVDPFLSHDGNRLYFSSNRPSARGESVFNHWYVDRVDSGWSDPLLVEAPLNSDSAEIYITMTKSGTAYFRTARWGSRDLTRVPFQNGSYQEAERLVFTQQGDSVYANNPAISSQEDFLVGMSFMPEHSDPDLFITWNTGQDWTELQNLGPKVNTPYTEFAAGLSKDDRTLYFTSERPGMVPALVDAEARPPGDLYAISLDKVAPGFLVDERGKEITIPTPDGVTVYGDLYTVDKANPTILLLHQGGANVRGEYHTIIPMLLEKEYNVLALDLRQGGERFGYFNRTAARTSERYHYCDAYPDVAAGLQYLEAEGYTKPVIWGSSFSATLAIQVGAERPEAVEAVLAFSPAQGPPMKECQPNPYFEQISVPLMVFRPRSELSYEGLTKQLAMIEEYGHQTYIAENGVHGSSMLVAERVEGDVTPHWDRVWAFLGEL
ncbi:MAG TPA: hypothetical protein DCR93_07065, partial [Cytophagales bacterium]|nr:hypothetical protein [Cytophagales bacterium]